MNSGRPSHPQGQRTLRSYTYKDLCQEPFAPPAHSPPANKAILIGTLLEQ